MSWNNSLVIILALVDSWGSGRHSILHVFTLNDSVPQVLWIVTFFENIGVSWRSAKVSHSWSAATSSDNNIAVMCFGVGLLGKGHPELISVGCCKDGLSLFAKLLTICFSHPIDMCVEGWEEVIKENSLEDTVLVQINTKNLFFVSSCVGKDFLDPMRPLSQGGKRGDEVAITKHALFDVVGHDSVGEDLRRIVFSIWEITSSGPLAAETIDILHFGRVSARAENGLHYGWEFMVRVKVILAIVESLL
jgi:hypothetical protein